MNIIKQLETTMKRCGLSPEEAAGYIGCSGSQVRRWIDGKFEPTPVYAQAIRQGIEKMQKAQTELESGKAVWTPQAPDDPAIIAEKARCAFERPLLAEFMAKASPAQRPLIAKGWPDFSELLALAIKLGIKLPTK